MTVYDISMGHEDVPEGLKEAGKRFGFPPDAYTGDWIRAYLDLLINYRTGKKAANES